MTSPAEWLYGPSSSVNPEPSISARIDEPLFLTDISSQRLQTANQVPASTIPSLEGSPVRNGSPLQTLGPGWGFPVSNASSATAEQMRGQHKAENDARGLEVYRQLMEYQRPPEGQLMGDSSMALPLDPYDQMLDMDPFGLSASMQFPSSFSFDNSSMK